MTPRYNITTLYYATALATAALVLAVVGVGLWWVMRGRSGYRESGGVDGY